MAGHHRLHSNIPPTYSPAHIPSRIGSGVTSDGIFTFAIPHPLAQFC